ncbi:MAG TPA: hypothetical protein VFM25_03505 [Verrucomicrobiae bacterium]|jgi:hypothetical protein|nr:hypothetical protein [Verrucomicrobiae bacterium]
MPNPPFIRPTFDEAMNAWKSILGERGFSTDLLWIFDENLCLEEDRSGKKEFSLGFQTQFTPPPPNADRVAFDYFRDFEARIIFYRIGSARGKSVCVMLCDEWFETKREAEGFIRRDDWLISFYPGTDSELEEITDERRWENRIIRNRPLHDLDFSMTLRAIHEILAHGRVLTSYEHYALKLLHTWSRFIGHSK